VVDLFFPFFKVILLIHYGTCTKETTTDIGGVGVGGITKPDDEDNEFIKINI
jgi:hypothetical protein